MAIGDDEFNLEGRSPQLHMKRDRITVHSRLLSVGELEVVGW